MGSSKKGYISKSHRDWILFRIKPGKDLYHNLLSIVKEHDVRFGRIMILIGRVKPVVVACYTNEKDAVRVSSDKNDYELLNGKGSLALYNELSTVDVKYAGRDFEVNGGYLIGGTKVLELVTGMILNVRRGYGAMLKEYGKRFEIEAGATLYGGLESIAQERKITSGGIIISSGKLRSVKIAFFDSKGKKYECQTFDDKGGYDLKNGEGTLAFEDDVLKSHVHVSFQGNSPLVYGGHLVDGQVMEPIRGYTIAVPGIRSDRVPVKGSISRLITFSEIDEEDEI